MGGLPLKRLKMETGHTPFFFPSKDEKSHVDTKTVSKLIGDRQCRFKNVSVQPPHPCSVCGAEG